MNLTTCYIEYFRGIVGLISVVVIVVLCMLLAGGLCERN